MAVREYPPGSAFPGTIGTTAEDSEPAWPEPVRAREGAPNVVLFVLDDVGYGQLSPFGGLCRTPTLDRLARGGLRYTNFQTTALCSPTRGCLLTGRNHHRLGLSAITELSLGYPAHNGIMGLEHGFLSEILLDHGYNTFAVGKWHLTPPEETTAAGPFRRWPLGRGFERYYGFLGGETDQWHPDLTYDNHPIAPPAKPEDGYHLNIDLADKAIAFIKDAQVNAPDKPFFLYYASGAGHAPHHVEAAWIERNKGRFNAGWDAYRETVFERQKELGIVPADASLSDRDPDVPDWDSLSADAKRMYRRQMEVYAAFLEQNDHHFGRVIDFIEKIGELDNTLIIALSDNGASAEGEVHGTFNEALFFNRIPERLEDNLKHFDDWGGPGTFPHYAWGWAAAGDTPFRRWKRETYRGGVTDPCILYWPKGIKAAGELRTQYTHAIDVVPTVLDALGLWAPESIRGVHQSPIEGVSFAHTFHDKDAPSRHHTQYFEMFGHRSIYHEGWKAVCPFPGPSFTEAARRNRFFGMPLTADLLDELDSRGWELYDLGDDFSETHNLAADEPEKLRQMIARWYVEAGTYGVLPLVSADLQRMNVERPTVARPREHYTYYSKGAPVGFAAVPRIFNRPHSITADVTITDGAEGVLLTQGSRNAGYALFVKDDRLHYVHNYCGLELFKVSSGETVPRGDVRLRYEFEPTGRPDFEAGKGSPGRAQLYINDRLVGQREIPYTTPAMFGALGMSCGFAAYDSVAPDDYQAPFKFSGDIRQVELDVSGDLIPDQKAEMKRVITQQ